MYVSRDGVVNLDMHTYGPVDCAIVVLKSLSAKCELLRQARCDAFEGPDA